MRADFKASDTWFFWNQYAEIFENIYPAYFYKKQESNHRGMNAQITRSYESYLLPETRFLLQAIKILIMTSGIIAIWENLEKAIKITCYLGLRSFELSPDEELCKISNNSFLARPGFLIA